jgi:rod shape-determining protein MreC
MKDSGMRRENRRLLTVGLLLLAAIILLTLGRESSFIRPVVSAVMAPLRPVMELLTDGVESVMNLDTEPIDYAVLEARALELERTVAEMQVEIVQLREIERDYERIAGILNYTIDSPDQGIVTADVIARDSSSYLRWIIINRGTRDGIQVGNPVINELGLVGRVENVAANAAWIRLANDPSSAVNALLQHARAQGTVLGQIEGGLQMAYIPQEAVVTEGDIVLTSGLGGTYPPNILIGYVASVRRQQADLFQSAEVRSSVDFDQIKIVSVITSFEPVDITIFNDVIESQGGSAP